MATVSTMPSETALQGNGTPPRPVAAAEEDEPPEGDYEGPAFSEMDPSGRYGRFDDVLGRGACKAVYKAFDTQEGTEVAWNQVRVSDLMMGRDTSKEDRDRMFAEIRVLKALKHKNIMTFMDSWYDQKTHTVNFITELFTSGTLRQYRKRHKHVDDEVLKRWAWQILCGLVYLHGHNPPIIHRDLKCDNIFINGSDGVVKIGDLGLATMLRSRSAPQSVLGTPEFMAPELYDEEYDDRVDVYSFGMALLELTTLEYPYSECTNAAQIYRKVSLGVRPAGLQKVRSRELAEFINLCISPRPSRPRSRQLLKHPYFDSIRQNLAPSKSEIFLANAAAEALLPHPSFAAATAAGNYGGLSLSQRPSSPPLDAILAAEAAAGVAPGSVNGKQPPPITSPHAGYAPSPIFSHTGGNGPPSSDAGSHSLRSQPSNVSELAAALGSLDLPPGGGGSAAGSAVGSRVASRATSPIKSPPEGPSPPTSPPKSPLQQQQQRSLSPAPAFAAGDQQAGTSGQVFPPPAPPLLPNSGSIPGAGAIGSDTSPEDTPCRCAETLRCFAVNGRYREHEDRNILSLRLRITEPDGTTRTVEFQFDLAHDTAVDVASEMVADLELSPEDANIIAEAMKREINALSAKLEGQASESLVQTAAALQQGLRENALLAANSTDVSVDTTGAGGGRHQLGDNNNPSVTLRPTTSASSLLSDASAGSAHSEQSVSSVQSSPAQLQATGEVSSAHRSARLDNNTSNAGAPSLARTLSVDRDTRGATNASSPIGHAGGTGAAGSRHHHSDRHFGIGSLTGFVSPPSGVLSPGSSHSAASSSHLNQPDKRSLSNLFENLQQVAKTREHGASVGGGMNGAATVPLGSSRPPLPPNVLQHHRSMPVMRSAPAAVTTPAPTGGGGTLQHLHSNGNGVSGNVSDGGDSQRSLCSREGSPERSLAGDINEGGSSNSLASKRSISAALAAGGCGSCGLRDKDREKESLRKQAADAMKAVEMRSLTLLQGNLGTAKVARGTPMAASKPAGGCAVAAAAAPPEKTTSTAVAAEEAPSARAASGGGGEAAAAPASAPASAPSSGGPSPASSSGDDKPLASAQAATAVKDTADSSAAPAPAPAPSTAPPAPAPG